uniref:Ig-like domain-containing protein n=1 Tax=Sinocyclocheilus grahami TaxID=75366 RepID=A0A672NYJ6_SINGR
TITETYRSDAGEYTFIAGKNRSTVNLHVQSEFPEPPQIIRHMEPLSVEGTATFIAKVGGDPIPNVKWMKGKWRQMTHGGRVNIQQKGQEAKLEIKEVTKSDSGQYRCVASNKHGEIECSTDLNVNEKKDSGPQVEDKDIDIVELLRNVDPKEYEKYARMYGITDFRGLLQAIEFLKKEKGEESGRPVDKSKLFLSREIQWMKAGQEITFSKRILYRVDKDKHTLTIKDCSLADEGEYSVVAGADKATAELIISEAPADFTAQLRDQTITEFEDAEFTCKLVEIKWMRNNMIIVQGDKYQMISEGKVHRLQVCEIRPRDQGEYRIVAKEKDARAKLELNLVTDAGKPFVMTVPYDAYPRAEAEWFYNDIKNNVVPSSRLAVHKSLNMCMLIIKDVSRQDSGEYSLVAENSTGKVDQTLKIIIRG